jgi:hypothetical protein
MKLVDVYWTPRINVLVVRCDCSRLFFHPANVATARCPACRRTQLWHIAEPQVPGTPFSGSRMDYELTGFGLWRLV